MRLIIRQEFDRRAATEFLELLRQLSRNAKLPLWHGLAASGERFDKPVRRFKKYCGFCAFGRCPQFALALAALHGKKSTERKFLS
jgi:hypothetical protein